MRFSGKIGEWFLDVQNHASKTLINGKALRVLDVGGGHGQNIQTIHSLGHTLTILGSNDECGHRIQSDITLGKVQFNTGSFLSLPYADRSFDVVITYRTLSHMDNWEAFIEELCRVSSHSVIIDYPEKFSFNVFSNFLFFLKKYVEKNTRRYLCFNQRQIDDAFSLHGFTHQARYKQFLLPMAAHRMLRMKTLSVFGEGLFRALGLTPLFGSPVVSCFAITSRSDKNLEVE